VKYYISIDSDTLLVTEFVNLKIKSDQSFRDAHRSRMCVYIYRVECSYMSICVYNIFLKKMGSVSYDSPTRQV
jgi:hypothetical protein